MRTWLKKRRDRKRCPHSHLRPIYGDEILAAKARLCCLDCNSLLDGSVFLAELRESEDAQVAAYRSTSDYGNGWSTT